MPYRITLAEARHLPELAKVEMAAASLFPPGSIPDKLRSDHVPYPVLLEAQQSGNLWVAVQTGYGAQAQDNTGSAQHEVGQVIGFALLCMVEGLALLAEIDVLPEHAGKGTGRALIKKVAQKTAASGHKYLYLTTFSHIPWNAPFYSRIGFVCLGEHETPPALHRILQQEKEAGLTQRVAMRLDLAQLSRVSL